MTSRLARMHEFNFAAPRDDSEVSAPAVSAPERDEARTPHGARLGLGGWLTALALTVGAIALSATAALEYLAPPKLAPGPVATPLETRSLQLEADFARAQARQAELALATRTAPSEPAATEQQMTAATQPTMAPVVERALPASETDNPY